MKPLKIVIISSVIYPRISPRSMRATELAKEFVRQGHNVTLYGVLGKYDYSQFEKEHGVKIKDLGPVRFVKLNSDGEVKYSFFHKVFRKLFKRTLEFPDIELAFKTNSVLKKEKDIDLLITIAVPFPIHWGAAYRKMRSSKNFPKVWVADCGDPYMGNPFMKHPFYFKYMEKWFCNKADFISIPIEEAKRAYFPEYKHKLRVIPQGFNFTEPNLKGLYKKNDKPTFIYSGTFYEGLRDPRPFLDLLIELNKDFRFIIYTKNIKLLEKYKGVLKDKLIIRDYVSRPELLTQLSQADFLINFENNTSLQSPSKLIDYALSGRPILSINTAQEINKEMVLDFLNSNYEKATIVENIEQYDIKNVAIQFLNLTNKVK